ncbi:type I restriction-modification system endonuclease [Legionella bozemanae]|uniref:type I restriction-modification system endonuclease n=1 Tax=Legionella bozemanae TaxID=447 RepID=UPI0010417B06|nr:type I restriction-modification system endonuclease [Legionella bozemanae]
MDTQSNFTFLKEHSPIFYQLAEMAEQSFARDPNTTLIKLRQLAEAIAQDIAARCGVEFDEQTTQLDLLYKLQRDGQFSRDIFQLFHTLRIEGNKATHSFETKHKEAINGLKIARQLAIWFHKSFGDQSKSFRVSPFIAPQDPSETLQNLHSQIENLKGQLIEANQKIEDNEQLNALLIKEKEEYSELAFEMDSETKNLEEQIKKQEEQLSKQQRDFEKHIEKLKNELADKASKVSPQENIKRAKIASQYISLTEEETRIIIDQQLIEAGWEADSQTITWKDGARPEKNKNKAIAEWPTTYNGQRNRADYVLFKSLTPIAIVEAKKENTNVAGKIPQAERYAKGFTLNSNMEGAWKLEGNMLPWHHETEPYYIPFVYSSNGRPYIKQIPEQSGTWFRDIRKKSNTAKPLEQFHTPDGLFDRLQRDKEEAERKLKEEPFSYLHLRDYQQKAIIAVETAINSGEEQCLLAMATGTGKTRTIIGLMYRLLKSERFKRILFLVDRNALGKQAQDVFNEAPLEQNQTLAKIYNLSHLSDIAAESETRIKVATVQAMVKRIFQSDTPPPVDEYDCIIVDEAHRGYTLDQEMTEGELIFRDNAQYLSAYRRVLDYFDAVRIGLTATPARHTTEIFGRPVFTYSYSEAVADDWLIDHEPPIRYETLLSKNGIHFDKGTQVSAINVKTGEVELAELEDELDFNIDAFNRKVFNEHFNKIICHELAVNELDPFDEKKTLIFCATDRHADMVKRLLDAEFKELYEDEYNQEAVAKITGQSDKVDQLIRRFKNERYPNIAITVDLLSTGIDVPSISNLVFLRRVKSRILYEQMLGRATRRCDEIGKTYFKIYDPVDIYTALEEVSTMKPLVKNPQITIDQLIEELSNPDLLEHAEQIPGNKDGKTYADELLDQLNQKLMKVLRKATYKAQYDEKMKTKLDELENLWSVEPGRLHQHLHELGPRRAIEFIRQHSGILKHIYEVGFLLGSENYPLISYHQDELVIREQNYGEYNKPEDYLESFNHFIKEQVNKSAALSVVVNRPKDLTRQQLKEVRLLLEESGFKESMLTTAWRDKTNHEIAASIIGFIRQAAIGEPLIPFEQRVHNAMEKIYSMHSWTPKQRTWLDRLAKACINEVIIDKESLNQRMANDGGVKLLNKSLNNQLDEILFQLNDSMWESKKQTRQ